MKAQIIQIGNSQGIRIPKMMLEESGITGEVEILTVPEGILIRRLRKPREDWEAQFRLISETDDDTADDFVPQDEFVQKQWQW